MSKSGCFCWSLLGKDSSLNFTFLLKIFWSFTMRSIFNALKSFRESFFSVFYYTTDIAKLSASSSRIGFCSCIKLMKGFIIIWNAQICNYNFQAFIWSLVLLYTFVFLLLLMFPLSLPSNFFSPIPSFIHKSLNDSWLSHISYLLAIYMTSKIVRSLPNWNFLNYLHFQNLIKKL